MVNATMIPIRTTMRKMASIIVIKNSNMVSTPICWCLGGCIDACGVEADEVE